MANETNNTEVAELSLNLGSNMVYIPVLGSYIPRDSMLAARVIATEKSSYTIERGDGFAYPMVKKSSSYQGTLIARLLASAIMLTEVEEDEGLNVVVLDEYPEDSFNDEVITELFEDASSAEDDDDDNDEEGEEEGAKTVKQPDAILLYEEDSEYVTLITRVDFSGDSSSGKIMNIKDSKPFKLISEISEKNAKALDANLERIGELINILNNKPASNDNVLDSSEEIDSDDEDEESNPMEEAQQELQKKIKWLENNVFGKASNTKVLKYSDNDYNMIAQDVITSVIVA